LIVHYSQGCVEIPLSRKHSANQDLMSARPKRGVIGATEKVSYQWNLDKTVHLP
jgi:hypothetical protein